MPCIVRVILAPVPSIPWHLSHTVDAIPEVFPERFNVPRPGIAAGKSHYGIGRTFHVMFDILTIKFLLRYFTRPMHFFGKLGLVGLIFGGAIMSYLTVFKLTGGELIQEHGPLMIAGALLLLGGIMMFSTGLLGEMMMRTYFESQGRRIYAVREVRSQKETKEAGGAR